MPSHLTSDIPTSSRPRRRQRNLPDKPLVLRGSQPQHIQVRQQRTAPELVDLVDIRQHLRRVRPIVGDVRQRHQHVVAESGRRAGDGILRVIGERGDAGEDAELGRLVFGVVEGTGGEAFEESGVGQVVVRIVEESVDVDYVGFPGVVIRSGHVFLVKVQMWRREG